MKSTFVLLSCWTFSANKQKTSWVVSSLGIWETRCSTSAEETAGHIITISDSLFVTLLIWFLLNAGKFQKTILVCTFANTKEMIKRWRANVSDLFWALPSVHCWKSFLVPLGQQGEPNFRQTLRLSTIYFLFLLCTCYQVLSEVQNMNMPLHSLSHFFLFLFSILWHLDFPLEYVS